jgi:hypothetical protein
MNHLLAKVLESRAVLELSRVGEAEGRSGILADHAFCRGWREDCRDCVK